MKGVQKEKINRTIAYRTINFYLVDQLYFIKLCKAEIIKFDFTLSMHKLSICLNKSLLYVQTYFEVLIIN